MRNQNLPCNRKLMNKYPPERIICYNLNITIDKNRLVRLFNILLPCSWITVRGFPFWGYLKFAGKKLCRNFLMYIFITLKGKWLRLKVIYYKLPKNYSFFYRPMKQIQSKSVHLLSFTYIHFWIGSKFSEPAFLYWYHLLKCQNNKHYLLLVLYVYLFSL